MFRHRRSPPRPIARCLIVKEIRSSAEKTDRHFAHALA
jgi:hypothetical protein